MVPRFGHDFSRVSVHSTGPGMIQTKLKINEPGDIYEQEADRVADAVMRMPEPQEEEEPIQAKQTSGQILQPSPVLQMQIRALRGGGQPLSVKERSFFEPHFGRDFSQVRVHSGMATEQLAKEVNARAFAIEKDVVFGAGEYAPETVDGKNLLAHEMTHVVQQQHNSTPYTPQSFGGDEYQTADMGADRIASRMVGMAMSNPVLAHPGPSLHRKVNVEKPKDLIKNPTGKGLVQTNAKTVEGYLRTLCSQGKVSVKGSGSVGADFCSKTANKSKEPTGCNCLCDMVGSPKYYMIVVDDKDWPHTLGRVVTTPSPNSPKLWGAATASGKAMNIDPWLVLGHELCGHAWLAEKGIPENKIRGEGGHQKAVRRENKLRKEHGIEGRGSFKDPYCGESFWQDKAKPGSVE